MSQNKQGGANKANTSSPSDLSIPTLGGLQSAPSTPLVQPGEEPGAAVVANQQAGVAASAVPTGNAEIDAFLGASSPPILDQSAPIAPTASGEDAPITRKEFAGFMEEIRATMQALAITQAKNNPVMARRDNDQFAEVPRQELEMPIDKALDTMRRPDKRQEQVDIDVVRELSKDHAAMLQFLDEPVTVNIAETSEPGAENPVVLWVNGRSCVIPRGRDMTVRRMYVELLLRAKPEGINTRITRDGDGNVKNHVDKTRALKYPFAIVHDTNPRGRAWAQKVRSEA